MEPKSFACIVCKHLVPKKCWLNISINCISINGRQGIQMLKKGSKVQFQDHHKQMPVPFVIYADFEAITEKSIWLPTKCRTILYRQILAAYSM